MFGFKKKKERKKVNTTAAVFNQVTNLSNHIKA